MTHTTTRRAATSAARELLAQELQERAELVAALWDARRAVGDAEAAAVAAQQQAREQRRRYAETRQAALAGGWTSEQLDGLGWTSEHSARRPAPRRTTPRSPAAAQPQAAAETTSSRPEAHDGAPTAEQATAAHDQPTGASPWVAQTEDPHR
jgi:hypothetical protein